MSYLNYIILQLMAQENQKYGLIVGETPRISQYLLSQELQDLSKQLNAKPDNLMFATFPWTAYPYSKLLPGPEPHLKLVAVFRQLIQKVEGKSNIEYPYLGLFMVDLSKEKISARNLLRKIDKDEKKVRELALHPNNRIVTIFFDNRVENYILKFQADLNYYAMFLNEHKFAVPLICNNLVYHPSGEFVVGLAVIKSLKSQAMYQAFKYGIKSNNVQYSEDLKQKCIGTNQIHYLSKWSIAIDKNNEFHAMIGAGAHNLCLLDLKSMKVQLLNFNRSSEHIIQRVISQLNITQLINDTLVSQACSFINSTSSGSFLCYQSEAIMAHRFERGSFGNYIHNGVFTYKPSFDVRKFDQIVKCIDIDHINAQACVQQTTTKIYISKLDRAQNRVYSLPTINTLIQGSDFGLGRLEDIIYSTRTSQICIILNLQVLCYKLKTNCNGDQLQNELSQCDQACTTFSKQLIYNPIKISCQPCQKCICNSTKQQYNLYFGRCSLDCSKIKYAVEGSEYSGGKKCACLNPFSWDDKLKMCRVDCSVIPYADHAANLAKFNESDCRCITNFEFKREQESVDEVGFCQLICPNGKKAELNKNQFICNCSHSQKWSSVSRKCISQNGIHQSSAAPLTWAIVLLVLLAIVALFIIGCLVWKKMKARKPKENAEEVPASSDRQERLQNGVSGDEKKSEQQLKEVKICTVCNIRESDANCIGPCGHYYHFYCIKERIDQKNLECPECTLPFPNGIGDMKTIENKDEVFTISDADT